MEKIKSLDFTTYSRCSLHISRFSLHISRCSLHISWFSLHNSRCSLHISRYSLYNSRCSLHNSRFSLHISRCLLHIARFSLHISRCSLNIFHASLVSILTTPVSDKTAAKKQWYITKIVFLTSRQPYAIHFFTELQCLPLGDPRNICTISWSCWSQKSLRKHKDTITSSSFIRLRDLSFQSKSIHGCGSQLIWSKTKTNYD